MESTRQHKIARLIQKDLSDIFLRYAKQIGGVLISVSEVRVSPDLSVANIYLSIFPDNREQELMNKITDDTGAIRGQLGTLERHQLRIIPELRFNRNSHSMEVLDCQETPECNQHYLGRFVLGGCRGHRCHDLRAECDERIRRGGGADVLATGCRIAHHTRRRQNHPSGR